MLLKLVTFTLAVTLLLGVATGAPHFRTEQDLKESFVKFLQQDQELSALIKEVNIEKGPVRHARAVEMDDEDQQDLTPGKPGFFDRAAKFVMEVLQRFLKWVNTED